MEYSAKIGQVNYPTCCNKHCHCAPICLSPQVILLLAQSEAFEFVLVDRGDVSVVNAQKLTLGSHVSASALFPIRPVSLGMMEISVDAVSAEASDSLVWRVLVKVCYDGNIGKYL